MCINNDEKNRRMSPRLTIYQLKNKNSGVLQLTIDSELNSKGIVEEQRETTNMRELEEISMKEIDFHSRMSEKYTSVNPPIIQRIEYNGMKDHGDQIILGTAQKIPKLEVDTNNFLQKLVSITGSLPNKA